MTAVFEVQSDIATSVINELDVVLLDSDRSIVDAVPTENLEAYHFYLRGLEYRRPDPSQFGRYFAAVSMFEKAVALDDRFAEAYAHLSMSHGDLRWFRLDPGPERLAAAKTAVDRAVELDPDGPLTHLALGYYCYFGTLDYDGALAHFENARRVQPSSKDAHSSIGFVKRRQGKWDEALENLKLAVELDPFDVGISQELAFTLSMMRRFEEANRYLDRMIEFAPELPAGYSLRSLNQVLQGKLEEARASAEAIPTDADLRGVHLMLVSSMERKYDECLAHLTNVRRIPASWSHQQYFPISMAIARVYEVLGRTEQAVAGYDSSRIHLEAMSSQYPADARVSGSLGIVYAKLGRHEDALREGRRAVELMPVSVDAVRGPTRRVELAEIYMIVGDFDRAVDELELLLETPASYITLPRLRLDPMWDPLRGFQRFEKLIEQ
jgi:tetratricopeptide (TPR) repeat protein